MKTEGIRPDYYGRLNPEPKDVIQDWGLNFNLGSAIKYISRAGHKNGEEKNTDLEKAITYLQFEMGEETKEDFDKEELRKHSHILCKFVKEALKDKKYIIWPFDKKLVDGHLLYRILAVKNFGDVNAGDFGGWIEKEENLSQEGNCWIHDEAIVMGESRVLDNAKMFDYTTLMNGAVAMGNSRMYENAILDGKCNISDFASIGGKTIIKIRID